MLMTWGPHLKNIGTQAVIWIQRVQYGDSLVLQWLGTPCFPCRGHRFNLGRGTKIPQAKWHGQRTTNKQKVSKNKKSLRVQYVFLSGSLECVNLSLCPPLFGICWTNPRCSFDDVTCCLQLYVAFFCREGKGSTESVNGRWFFTWDSKSKTEGKLWCFGYMFDYGVFCHQFLKVVFQFVMRNCKDNNK